MNIVRYRDQQSGEPRYGVLEETTVYAADGDPFTGLQRGSVIGEAKSADLLAPIVPGKVVCVGLNYVAHVTERDATRKIPEEPVIFMKPPAAVIGPGQAIEIAYLDHETHYEAEIAIVIGKKARDVAAGDALGFILGYTCGNDVSDRFLQGKDGQWVRAKGFDTYCPLGPCIATEIDLSSAKVESRLNGQVRQSATSADMIFSIPFLVSFISGVMTLDPGDVIMTGTPHGVGPLHPGDVIEVEVGGVGTLRNPVTARKR